MLNIIKVMKYESKENIMLNISKPQIEIMPTYSFTLIMTEDDRRTLMANNFLFKRLEGSSLEQRQAKGNTY